MTGGKPSRSARRGPTEPSPTGALLDVEGAGELEATRLELREARAQQSAVAEVLKVIGNSTSDLQPTLEAIVAAASQLCQTDGAAIFRRYGDEWGFAAGAGSGLALSRAHYKLESPPTTVLARCVAERTTIHSRDARRDGLPDPDRSLTRLGVPVSRSGEVTVVIVVAREEAGGFSDREVELVETFADQAAIAIENVRLFNATNEALAQQTAVAEVLKTISRSALDLQSVLDTVVENAAQLCDADAAWVTSPSVERRLMAFSSGFPLERRRAALETRPPTSGTLGVMQQVYATGKTSHIADIETDPELNAAAYVVRGMGGRTVLAVPVLREGHPIAGIVLTRGQVRPFTDREVELAETFASQAGIAIENVRLFNEIQRKSQELEVASRHKSEFLANMSHELRTPLNAIIGFSEVLEQRMFGELNERQAEYTRDIATSGRHLLTLVNEILDLAKIEAGRMELEVSAFAPAETIRGALGFVRERAAGHRITLDVDLPEDLGTVVADERKIRQVLLNLLSNAVKFTPDGGRVTLRARHRNGELEVAVQDTGIGIFPDDLSRVFEEFQQVGLASERSREGTGLGLTLAKRFVELHGGRIWVESAVGAGTTFTFTIPMDRASLPR